MPDSDPSTTQEIFRQAIAKNAEIHESAMANMQRQTDEVHTQLRMITNHAMSGMMLGDFAYVNSAARLSPEFWAETVARAKVVLQQAGVLPPDAPGPANENSGEPQPGN